MATNRYDQASRYLAGQAGARLWPWLLGLTREQVRFERPLETQFTVPGFPERIGDLAAALTDLENDGRPWAVCLEFQSEPDFDMADRLLVELGLVRLTQRPSGHPGDRYWVGAVVVNLTGQGSAERDLEWRGAGLRLLLQPREWNLAALDAAEVLDEVEQGVAPVEAMAWVALMQRGGDSAIIRRRVRLAGGQTDPVRRGNLGLALVFAELAKRKDVWAKALEGWNVLESQIVKQWEQKAAAMAKAELILRLLEKRFEDVPDDLRAALLAESDAQRLTALFDVGLAARSLRGFRKKADL
jgi:hypothetical protein